MHPLLQEIFSAHNVSALRRKNVEIPVKINSQNLLPPSDLAMENEQLREDLRNERERNLRTLADFNNYRRRIEHEGNKVAQESVRDFILPLLDIVDDIGKAVQWAGDHEDSIVQGVRIIHRKLLAMLERHGVLPFESVGTPFNPAVHEAVTMARHEGREPGTVVEELRRGYLWMGELLRPAQVRVAE
jgi:molecular chaperone GrpE